MQSFKQFLVRLIVLIFFLTWTFLLGVETWDIQQSCTPMIQPIPGSDVAKVLSDRCKPPCPTPKTLVDGICVEPGKLCSPGKILVDDKCVSEKCRNGDMAGLAAGTLATAGAAALGPPAFLLVGIGVAVWFLTRTVIKAISCN